AAAPSVTSSALPQPASATSPTPMIAAMIKGGTPPSFAVNDAELPRRTSVSPSQPTDTIVARAPDGQQPFAVQPQMPAMASAGTMPAATAEQTDIRSGPASAAALAAAPQPLLNRTYRDQLRAAGIDAGDQTAPVAAVPPAAPGQFPSRVPAVVQQTYRESLNAPKTWEQAVGIAPMSAPASVVTIGGTGGTAAGGAIPSGPVVISGQGVYQPASHFAGTGTGARLTIQFANNSAKLSPSDVEMIRPVAEEAKRTGASVRVVGHSSSRTGEMRVGSHLLANLQISADRAEAVADALARFGVPYQRIVVEAKGDNQPIFNEAMPSGEAGNRRAEIYLEN
ncbi:MAG: OmpA family protein, partial [Pseudomonadota bacterium]|nr:OmpA family protein [Pseudomonadota bacterium]